MNKDNNIIKVVFEYSYENKFFDDSNPKFKSIIEAIFEYGIDNYNIYAMNTDTNAISDKISKEFTYLFLLLEKNRSLCSQYGEYLVLNKNLEVKLPEDEEIVNNKKLLKKYYEKEVFVLVSLQMLKRVFEYNFHKLANNDNYFKLDAYVKDLYFKFYLNKEDIKNIDKDFYKRLYANLLSVADLPIEIIFETVIPAFCEKFTDYDVNKKDVLLDINKYNISVA